MSTTRVLLRPMAKQYAQDTETVPLLAGPNDYDRCIDGALKEFDQARPRIWLFDHTVTAAAFRFVLFGTGAILPSSGIRAWSDGFSSVQRVWWPYDASSQGVLPVDDNEFQVVDGLDGSGDPTKVLEFLAATPGVGDVIRVTYTNRHQVHENTAAQTTVRAGDVEILAVLVAAIICEEAAIRYAQNTGSSGLQNDTVDRRTQSDVMKARAKLLRDRYAMLIGLATGEAGAAAAVQPASAFKDIDMDASHQLGMLWHPTSRR